MAQQVEQQPMRQQQVARQQQQMAQHVQQQPIRQQQLARQQQQPLAQQVQQQPIRQQQRVARGFGAGVGQAPRRHDQVSDHGSRR